MYLTKDLIKENGENFNWNEYLPNKKVEPGKQTIPNSSEIILETRKILQENGYNMTIAFSKVMNELLEGTVITNPEIIELGAATGFTSKWLLNKFGGNALLIDNSEASYETYFKDSKNYKSITYKVEDIFKLSTEKEFDITCSFGLIEHFIDKTEVLKIHQKFLKREGYSIILIPLDSPLSRVFYEVHHELNLGYRELLTENEFKDVLIKSGFTVLKMASTKNYVYDFGAALCKINNK